MGTDYEAADLPIETLTERLLSCTDEQEFDTVGRTHHLFSQIGPG
jgi:hypothetical protein